MTVKIELYYHLLSPVCRSVLMLAKALKVDLSYKEIDLLAGEQLNPEFVKLNPQHSIPTMVEGEFVLWESRAIMQYFVDEYDLEKKFVPSNSKDAAVLQQRLIFDAGILAPRFADFAFDVVGYAKPPNEEKREKFVEAVDLLDQFLEMNKFIAGPKLTIVDFSAVATIATADVVNIPVRNYTNVWRWYQKMMEELADFGYSEYNEKGANIVSDIFRKNTNDIY